MSDARGRTVLPDQCPHCGSRDITIALGQTTADLDCRSCDQAVVYEGGPRSWRVKEARR